MPARKQPRKQPGTLDELAPHALRRQAERRILFLRRQRVMLDFDLAELYGIETRALKQAVRRNRDRFPDDFMFEFDDTEAGILVSQTVIPSRGKLGGAAPMAFTEQGVAMLSSVLRSPRAVQVNIGIMRAFVRLRELLLSHADLAPKWHMRPACDPHRRPQGALPCLPTRALNQAVKRHAGRFPEGFMFQLTDWEAAALRSQFVAANSQLFDNQSLAASKSQSVTLKRGHNNKEIGFHVKDRSRPYRTRRKTTA